VSGLWRRPDFLKLWLGQTVAQCGSQVSDLAVPLTAALLLGATPGQMGLLRASTFAPYLLVGLLAGVWVDRLPRRPILILGDVGRAVLLASIPAAWLLGWLSITQLYVVGLLAGTLTVFFEIGYQSYLPTLIERHELVEGNSKLETSRSLAFVAGPSLAGGLVQALSAPLAVVTNAVTFAVSAMCLFLITAPEPVNRRVSDRASVREEIWQGLRAVLGDRVLRPLAASTAVFNFFFNTLFAVYILYLTRELGVMPAVLGVILAAFGVGGILGALTAASAARWFGLGPAIIGALFLSSVGATLVPIAGGSLALMVALLALGSGVFGAGVVSYMVNALSLRQAITDDSLQGRVNATMRFIMWGAIPLGALAGGALGDALGLRSTLLIGALGTPLGGVCLLCSPVRALREPPELRSEYLSPTRARRSRHHDLEVQNAELFFERDTAYAYADQRAGHPDCA